VNRRPNPFTVRKPRSAPPAETGQEASFLRALGLNQAQVSIRLVNGEVVTGWVEYYDERMVRLTRNGAPNLFIYKDQIAYIAEGNANAETKTRDQS